MEEVTQLMNQLRRKRLWGEPLADEWEKEAAGIVGEDAVDILRCLIRDNVWYWQPVINRLMPSLAEHPDFLGLLAEIAHGGYAAPLWDGLIVTGSIHPTESKSAVRELLQRKLPSVSSLVAALAVGISREDRIWAVNKAKELLESKEPTDQRAGFATISGWPATDSDRPKLALLALSLGLPQDPDVQRGYSLCLQTIHDIYPRETEDKLYVAFSKTTSPLRESILGLISSLPDLPADYLRRVVTEAWDGTERIGEPLSILLSEIYASDPDFVLDRLHEAATKGFLTDILGLNGKWILLDTISKKDPWALFRAIDTWLEKPTSHLAMQAGDILKDVFEKQPFDLIKGTRIWDDPNDLRCQIRLHILRDLISERLKTRADPVTAECTKEILTIATKLGLDVKTICKGETDPRFQALMLARHLLLPHVKVDYEQLLKNLGLIPSLRDFLGLGWFEDYRNAEKGHLIFHMFDHAPPAEKEVYQAIENIRDLTTRMTEARREVESMTRKQFDDLTSLVSQATKSQRTIEKYRIFGYWDDVFRRLDTRLKGIGQMRRELKQIEGTEDILCEAEIASFLLRDFPVEIKPKMQGIGSRPDLRVQLTEQTPILEIYNLGLERIIEFASGTHGLSIHRLRDKILEKFGRQFAEEGLEDPLVFVVNTNGTTTSDFEVEEMLRGRENLTSKDPRSVAISGILLYRRDYLSYVKKPGVRVQYHPNPDARVPLSARSIQELTRTLSPK